MDTLTDYLIEFGYRPDEAVTYRFKSDHSALSLPYMSNQDVSRNQEAAAGEVWDKLIVQGVEVMPPSPEDEDEDKDKDEDYR